MSVGDVAFSASSLLGPTGGLIGLAFAAGATAGWSFAVRTVLKLTNKQFEDLKEESKRERDQCNQRLDHLANQLNDLRERYTMGLERQAAQIRESGYRVLHGGHERFEQTDPPKQP